MRDMGQEIQRLDLLGQKTRTKIKNERSHDAYTFSDIIFPLKQFLLILMVKAWASNLVRKVRCKYTFVSCKPSNTQPSVNTD